MIVRLVFRFMFIVLLNGVEHVCRCQASVSFVCFDMDEVSCLVLLGIRIEVHVRFVNCRGRCRCVDVVNGVQKACQQMRN